jgi:hypothetical protein
MQWKRVGLDFFGVKFIFSKKATKNTKSSPSIWHLLSKRQIYGDDFIIFVAFLENMNFKVFYGWWPCFLEPIWTFKIYNPIKRNLNSFA